MTTYRLTEHHTAGGMSRVVGHLSELQPEMFCEVSPELAALRGLDERRLGHHRQLPGRHRGPGAGDRPDRAAAGAAAGPSTRSACRTTGARRGLVTGDSANDLFPLALDPNVHIQEVKAATCDIRPGRRPRGAGRASAGGRLSAPPTDPRTRQSPDRSPT